MVPPPGYVAYGNAPTPVARVHRLKGLSTAVTILVGLSALGAIISALLQTSVNTKAQEFLDGTITESEFVDSITGWSAVAGVSGLAMLAGMVLVMIWMYRVAANLRAYGIPTTWHPLWAIFGWFLPPGALYIIPLLMFREQWSKSTPASIGQPSPMTKQGDSPALWVWWVCFGLWPVVSILVNGSASFGNMGNTDADATAENLVETGNLMAMLSGVATVVAGAAFIAFVRQLTARQGALTGEQ